MIWKLKPYNEYRWRKWYAWYPVCISDSNIAVWDQLIWYRLVKMSHVYPQGWSYTYQYSLAPTEESVEQYNARQSGKRF